MTSALTQHLLQRRTLFFGGKGGVGKTTVASAFALMSADRGDRTLLVSTDPAHSTSDILERRLTGEPQQVVDNLWAMEIDPEHEVDAYIADVKARVADSVPPRLAGEVERQIDIAVHSLKDLPSDETEGLTLAAFLHRDDPRDALISRTGGDLSSLPQNASIGTGSPRRAALLLLGASQ